ASNFSEIKHKHVTEKPNAPTQLNLLLPISIEEAILKAMQKKSEDRHASVKDFVMSLSTSASGHTRTPKPPPVDAAIPASPASFDQPASVTGTPKDAEPELEGTGRRKDRNNQNANVSLPAPTWQYTPLQENAHGTGLQTPSAFQQSTRVVAKQGNLPKEE